MEQMKELYAKVAADPELQAKITEILNGAEQAGEEATGKKLVLFAKDAGYDIRLDEMKNFFAELTGQNEGVLSDTEMDMVAGGKLDGTAIGCSICSLGFTCALASVVSKIATDSCGRYFTTPYHHG